MTKKGLRPKLIVIAGPNGAGKTTFTNQVLRHDWSAGCVFINPDEIARHDFGDWNSPDAVMKAVVRAQDLREECLRARRSMLIETVFSVPDKLDFVRRVKEADFFIRFFLSAPTARTSMQPVSSGESWMAGTMFPRRSEATRVGADDDRGTGEACASCSGAWLGAGLPTLPDRATTEIRCYPLEESGPYGKTILQGTRPPL